MTYDEVQAGGESKLKEAVEAGAQESLTLDFKLATEGEGVFKEDGALTTEGKRVVAKILSAFSNSAGGLVVFGVNCRKDDDNIDCASALAPFKGFKQAASTLNSAVGDLLQPKNAGIRVSSFPANDDISKGYVIIDVPRSERRPHRSEAAKQKAYFKRSGASSYEMEHYDIEDAFRRQSSPELTAEIHFSEGYRIDSTLTVELRFYITNISIISAQHTMLEFSDAQHTTYQWIAEDDWAVKGVRMTRVGQAVKYYTNADFIIHPQDTRPIGQATFRVNLDGDGYPTGFPFGKKRPMEQPLKFTLRAKDMRTNRGVFDFNDVSIDDRPWKSQKISRQANLASSNEQL